MSLEDQTIADMTSNSTSYSWLQAGLQDAANRVNKAATTFDILAPLVRNAVDKKKQTESRKASGGSSPSKNNRVNSDK